MKLYIEGIRVLTFEDLHQAQMVLRSRVQAALEDEEAAETDEALVDDLALDDDAAAESEGEGAGEGEEEGAGAGSSAGGKRCEGVREEESGDDEEADARMAVEGARVGGESGGGCQPRVAGVRGGNVGARGGSREVKNLGLDSMYSERERAAEVLREKLLLHGGVGSSAGALSSGKKVDGVGAGGRATRGMLAGTWGLGRRAPTELYLLIHNIESPVSGVPGRFPEVPGRFLTDGGAGPRCNHEDVLVARAQGCGSVLGCRDVCLCESV